MPRNEQQIPRGIKSNPEILSCSIPKLWEKNRQSFELSDTWPPGGLMHTEKLVQYILGNEQQIPRGIKSNPEVLLCFEPRLCQDNTQFLELSNYLAS